MNKKFKPVSTVNDFNGLQKNIDKTKYLWNHIDMAFKTLNPANNPKKKILLQKELQRLRHNLHNITLQSHHLLANLQEIADRKLAEEKMKAFKAT